jgi:hypothetical protein
MKRFQLWLTAAIMFPLPALVFAQCTGGSPGRKLDYHKGGASAGTGRKGTVQPEVRKKTNVNAQKNACTLNPQPLAPINHAPVVGKGAGNAPPLPVPPKAGNSTGKVYRKGSGTGRKGKVEHTDTDKKLIKGTPTTQK